MGRRPDKYTTPPPPPKVKDPTVAELRQALQPFGVMYLSQMKRRELLEYISKLSEQQRMHLAGRLVDITNGRIRTVPRR